MIECKEGVIKDPIRGEGHLLVRHFFGFIHDVADPGFLQGVAILCNVANFVTVEALAQWPVPLLVWFNLCHVPLGWSVVPVRSAGLIAHVHWDWLIVHPLQSIR